MMQLYIHFTGTDFNESIIMGPRAFLIETLGQVQEVSVTISRPLNIT